jgi:DNA repair protein RecO (recombination protein O)
MKFKTQAIPIRVVDFSNTSQVVALFTRERGLVDGIAKGAHRPQSGFQGPFDLAVLYEVVVFDRRASGLSILTESTVLDGLRGLRSKWFRHVAACHVLEFLRVVAVAGEREAALFDAAKTALEALGEAPARTMGAILTRFDARALAALGLLAPIRACVACGREWPGERRGAFVSPKDGGLLCRLCRDRLHAPGEALDGRAVRLLQLLAADVLPAESTAGLDEAWTRWGTKVASVVSRLRNQLLEREFSALRWLRISA